MANFEVKSFKVDENKPLFICFKQGILDYTFEAYLCLNICTISLCQMHMAIFFLNVCLCCLYPVDFKRLQCPPPNRQHILTPLVENETSKTASSSVSSRLEVNKQLTSCLTGSKQRSSRAVSLEPRSLSSYKHNTLGVGATISNAVPSSTIPQ